MPAEIIELSKGSDGRWVTINGVHVHIGTDGRIDKGPSHFEGKKPDQIDDHENSGGLLHKEGHAARKVEHAMNGGAEHHAKAVEELEHMDAADVIDAAKEHGIKGVTSKPKAIAALREHMAASKPAEPAPAPSADKFTPGRTAYTDPATGEQRHLVTAKVKGERVMWSEDSQGNRVTPARPYDANAVRGITGPGKGLIGDDVTGGIDRSEPPKGKRKHAMSRDAVYLSTGTPSPVTPALTLGQGLPTKIKVKVGDDLTEIPVSYWQGDVIAAATYKHPSTGETLEAPPERIDGWIRTFDAMRAAGRSIPTPTTHYGDDARDNIGEVISMNRVGDRLRLVKQVKGHDGAAIASRNYASIKIDPHYVDEFGKDWGEAIVHCAFTSKPVITGMGEFTPFVASRDGETGTPIFLLSADDGDSDMELTNALRQALGVAADVPDDKLIEGVRTLRTKADADAARVVELSRKPAEPDPEAFADRNESKRERIELSRDCGDMPKSVADELLAALPAGKPNVFMLSRTDALTTKDGAKTAPIDFVLGLFKDKKLGVAVGSQTGAQGVVLSRQTPGGEASEEQKAVDADADAQAAAIRASRGIK